MSGSAAQAVSVTGGDTPSRRPAGARSRRRRHPQATGVILAGVAALIASGGFGTPALRPVGIGLVILGLGAIVAVEAVARAVRISRTINRRHADGQELTISVQLRGWPVTSGVIRLLEWTVRPGAPSGARIEARRPQKVAQGVQQDFIVRGLSRGEHRLAPPSVGLGDPFGLARVRRSSTSTSTLLVLPDTVPVVVPFWESAAARRSGSHVGMLRGRSELSGVRDYEPGDPFSLIHWPQTARRGRLQTKELHGESGRGASLVVFLDAAADPAQGGKPDGPFELAVSAAASLIAACSRRGDRVGLEHSGSQGCLLPVGSSAVEMERALALVEADGTESAGARVRSVTSRATVPRTIVIVSARPDHGLAAAARHARSMGIGVAAVLTGAGIGLAQDLRRSGVWVAEAQSRSGLAAAIDAGGRNAST